MKKCYRLGVKAGTEITFMGEVEYLMEDYWTSIKLEEGTSDQCVIYNGKANLYKQISKRMFGNIRMWKHIYIYNSDIEVVR